MVNIGLHQSKKVTIKTNKISKGHIRPGWVGLIIPWN